MQKRPLRAILCKENQNNNNKKNPQKKPQQKQKPKTNENHASQKPQIQQHRNREQTILCIVLCFKMLQ